MQLKGLVRFFAVLLILICLYQLSFTWMVHSHESEMKERAASWAKANHPLLEGDSLANMEKERLKRLLDSTGDAEIGPFGLTTYQSAKDKELKLGLDLQGGMSVTLEVGMEGLLKSLANYTRDPAFNKALSAALTRKATKGDDLITLFNEEFSKAAPGAKLAPIFSARSNGVIKYDASNGETISYLRTQAKNAFDNTVMVIRKRIDAFGLASPSINPDPAKGIINVELAGITDPERVKRYLQTTANLQFFEVYNANDIGEAFDKAEKALAAYLKGTTVSVDTANKPATPDSNLVVATPANKTDTTQLSKLSDFSDTGNKQNTAKITDSANDKKDHPIASLLQSAGGGTRDEKGNFRFPAQIAYVRKLDTGILGSYLRMDMVSSQFPPTLRFVYGAVENNAGGASKDILALYAIRTLDNGQAKLEGENVKDARQDIDERGKVAVAMSMTSTGSKIWAKMTGDNVGKPIAIVLDNFVYSAPNVIGAITGGNSQITGSYSISEAQDLAKVLNSGKLPAPAKIAASQVVGPTLGEASIKGGGLSFLISFIVIFALMLIYYNTAGWVANIALILNLLFTIGILASWGLTLTAPSIAGLVLTIGMAVDTNVIIFERIKEELSKGKGYLTAVNDGYKRSYAPVIDAHVTTFLTALILFTFGLGPVLGFATTQMIGIVLSLFCGILVSRLITDFYTNKQRHFEYFTSISKRVFKHASFKFIEYRKVAYGISVVVLLLGVGAFFNGFDEGVEFSGGRSYTIKFPKAPDVEAIKSELKTTFNEIPIIKTVNTNDQLNITTSYKIKEAGNNVDSVVEAALFKGLEKFLPAGVTYAEFDKNYKQSSQTVLPSISDDLKKGATKATIISIIVICLYIFIRFRDWRYSMGTIVALLHDVFVTLAVFSFCRSFVPFALEIDQHFIAALLTVIGFSMNDTVIVYDRIREDSKLMRHADKTTIINTAINQTLSRTIMTSLTVFLTILILFIFGGEATRGFAFAMLIGVITGTYSSIFVAAPILVDFAKNKPLAGQEDAEKKTTPVAKKMVKQ